MSTILVLLALNRVGLGDTYHVSPNGDDANDGLSWASAKATTQGGGGVWISSGKPVLTNCVLYANEAPLGANYYGAPAFAYTCTTLTAEADGNLQADTQFRVAGTGAGTNLVSGDYRLPRRFPCSDKGCEFPWMDGARDLDGNPRVGGPAPDMGAYEYTLSRLGTRMLVR